MNLWRTANNMLLKNRDKTKKTLMKVHDVIATSTVQNRPSTSGCSYVITLPNGITVESFKSKK